MSGYVDHTSILIGWYGGKKTTKLVSKMWLDKVFFIYYLIISHV